MDDSVTLENGYLKVVLSSETGLMDVSQLNMFLCSTIQYNTI